MTSLYERKWRTKDPVVENKKGEWKFWLKVNIQKTQIIASGPITSWHMDGETLETVAPKLLQIVTAAMKLPDSNSLKEKLWPT